MILIIGGAYQGKLAYAQEHLGVKPEQIFTCEKDEVDFSKPCINALEQFTWACTQTGVDPIAYFAQHQAQWEDAVLICRDIFCGVVPMDDRERQWRQDTARLCQYLAQNAQQVSRMFCGLEQRLK